MSCECWKKTNRPIADMFRWLALLALLIALPAQAMEVVGSLTLPDRTGVVIRGDVVHTVGQTDYTSVTIEQPGSPSVLGSLSLNMAMEAVDVEGDYAYCAGGGNGFVVVNVSNPQSPSWVHTTVLTGPCLDIAADDTILVVAIGTAVVILGVRNPASPNFLASYSHSVTSVAINWPMRRVWAGGTNGIVELDISNPRSPVRRSQFGAGLPASPIAYSPPYVDAVSSFRLLTLDASPLGQEGAFTASAGIRAVCEGGGHQTLIGLANGDVVHIDETQMPPSMAASANVGAQIRRMDTERIRDDTYAACATTSGITIVSYDAISSAEPSQPMPVPQSLRLSAYPNPFNGSVRLRLEGAASGFYAFELFDIAGRKVAAESFFWTGDFTFSPEALATGVYFARMTGTSGIGKTRLIYLK